MPEITWKIYTPLHADFYPLDVYNDLDRMDHECPDWIEGKELARYAESIQLTLAERNKRSHDLAASISKKTAPVLVRKVCSIVPFMEIVNGEPMGCATVKLRAPLDDAETAALCGHLKNEYENGWGEWRASKEIEVDDGVVFLAFYCEDDFCMTVDKDPVGVREDHQKNTVRHKYGDAR